MYYNVQLRAKLKVITPKFYRITVFNSNIIKILTQQSLLLKLS